MICSRQESQGWHELGRKRLWGYMLMCVSEFLPASKGDIRQAPSRTVPLAPGRIAHPSSRHPSTSAWNLERRDNGSPGHRRRGGPSQVTGGVRKDTAFGGQEPPQVPIDQDKVGAVGSAGRAGQGRVLEQRARQEPNYASRGGGALSRKNTKPETQPALFPWAGRPSVQNCEP